MKISKSTQHKVLGGAIGALAVNMESALSFFVAGYPAVLRSKLNPNLPSNGALVANVAPPVVALAMKKKNSERAKCLKTGIYLYDFPKLLDQIAYNVAYQMGRPAGATATRLGSPMFNVRIQPQMNTSGGKYTLQASAPASMGSGMGKYR